MMVNKTFYENKINEANLKLTYLKKQALLSGLIRLVVFVFLAVLLYQFITSTNNLLIVVFIVFFILFSYLFYLDSLNKLKQKQCLSLKDVAQRYLNRYDHQFNDVVEDGLAFSNEHQYADFDLDIIGKKSLYQYLNETKSYLGMKYLYQWLSSDNPNLKESLKRQQAIEELAQEPESHIQLLSIINLQKASYQVINFTTQPQALKLINQQKLTLLKIILPLTIFYSSIILYSLNIISIIFPISFFVLNIIISNIHHRQSSAILEEIHNKKQEIAATLRLITYLESKSYQSSLLQDITSLLNNKKASQTFKQLKRISDYHSYENSAMSLFILQGFSMWNLLNMYLYLKWQKDNTKDANEYIKVCSQVEALASLAIVGHVMPHTSLALYNESTTPIINMNEMYHPLLPATKIVSNSYNGSSQTTIITGSNMAGKTTFIRGVGINIL
ncbi:MAG: hypothetical protein ACRCTA_01700, partial [Bacilli bacterium]